MKLHIQTQVEENYGAHDWDGVGVCPQYWKMKGGNDYMISLGTSISNAERLNALVASARPQIEEDSQYYREYILGWDVVEDDYLTDFERSQLEYEGEITCRAIVVEV